MEWVDLFQQISGNHVFLVGAGIFAVLLLCGFGLPLPEDIVLLFTGYACFRGVLPIWLAILIAMAGVLIGDSTLWWIGQRYGGSVMDLGVFRRFLPPVRLEKIRDGFHRRHGRMLFSARFMPGLRSGVFLFAGWSRVAYSKFLIADGSAALLSVPAIILAAFFLGHQIELAFGMVRGIEHWVISVILIIALVHALRAHRRKLREQLEAAVARAGQTVEIFPEGQATGTNG